jgi:hypothetical protein
MLFLFMSKIDSRVSTKLDWEALEHKQTWNFMNVKYVTQNPF